MFIATIGYLNWFGHFEWLGNEDFYISKNTTRHPKHEFTKVHNESDNDWSLQWNLCVSKSELCHANGNICPTILCWIGIKSGIDAWIASAWSKLFSFSHQLEYFINYVGIIQLFPQELNGAPLQVYHNQHRCMHIVLGLSHTKPSFGLQDVPYVFTRIPPYLSWIEQIVWPLQ